MDRVSLFREMGLGPLWQLRPELRSPIQTQAGEQAQDSPATATTSETTTDVGIVSARRGSESGTRSELDWPTLARTVAACQACRLGKKRQQAVLGVGDTQADWLFVGEGPGAEEDQRGEPFVGQAGKLLDAMLAAIGLRRGEDVYIANTVKCRPPDNRTPEADESAACFPYLAQQIALIRPRLIVALGKPAAQTLLARETSIAAARGSVHRYGDIPLIVTYHPAYLLRNLPDKAKAWEDLVFMRRTMAGLKDK